jgi:hypothetical protein
VHPRAGEPPDDDDVAKPSTNALIPNPVSAIEPATTPVAMPTRPSVPIHASETQESIRARFAARSHSADAAGRAACPTTVSSRTVALIPPTS